MYYTEQIKITSEVAKYFDFTVLIIIHIRLSQKLMIIIL